MMVVTLERPFAMMRMMVRPFVDALQAQNKQPKAKSYSC
mgnify:CR=1 FL=1